MYGDITRIGRSARSLYYQSNQYGHKTSSYSGIKKHILRKHQDTNSNPT
jgi:hypothetical protein